MKLKRIFMNAAAVLILALALVAVPAVTVSPSLPHAAAAPPASPAPSPSPSPSSPSSATCPDAATSKGKVLQGLGQTGSNCSDEQVNSTLRTAVTILSLVVGISSVLVIILSGFKYMASGGEQNKVANAKNSLIYAMVGLAVAASTQLLIHFVLYNTTT